MRLQELLVSRKRPLIMGILNCTPDSFSDGGAYQDVEAAVTRGLRMEEEGADIIDIGGESTRPGFTPVSVQEECERILPVMEKLRRRTSLPISVDTYKPEVAREALKAGAVLVNDISGCAEEGMEALVAEAGCLYCLTYNRPEDTEIEIESEKDASDVYISGQGFLPRMRGEDYARSAAEYLQSKAERMIRAGVLKEQIILDPGIGFSKSWEQNRCLVKYLDFPVQTDYPVLLGISRKSLIGNALHLPVEERLEGTLALDIFGAMKGVKILRVHDVEAHFRALKMLEFVV